MDRLHEGFNLGGRYTLTSRVAGGGMGEVWRAKDGILRRVVAVKIMRPGLVDDAVVLERFRAEARHAARLTHPNIATVHDYGEDGQLAFLVMELVEGEPLSKLMARLGPLRPERVRIIMGQAARALAAAHAAGVIHRDVKPANILVRGDGAVKLTDFGIARALDVSGQTRTGEVLGTAFYLSPEQAMGRTATAASDLYALGIVAHEMLGGRRPFEADTPIATVLAHLNQEPPPLPDDVDPTLVHVIMSCLAKDPAHRPAGADAVAAALGYPVDAPVLAEVMPLPESARTPIGSTLDTGALAALSTADLGATQIWSSPFVTPGAPMEDLEEILAHLDPELHDGTFVVVSVTEPVDGAHPFMTLQEKEGLTMLLRQEEADGLGLEYELPLAWITLGAYRKIGSVGLVATASSALAQASISCVAGVGRWHTHLYVPAKDAERAMRVLRRLWAAHRDEE